MSVAPPRRLPRHPRVWWSRIKYKWPFLVWAAALWAVFQLYMVGARTIRMPGVIEALREEAAPVQDARLVSVQVTAGQEVLPGDVLARFDASLSDAELAVEQLQAERQFISVIAGIGDRLRDLKMRQASEQLRLDVLRAESGKLVELMAAGVEDAARLAYFRAEQQALAKGIELYPAEIAALEREQTEARSRLETARAWFASASGGAVGATNPPPAGLEAIAETVSLLRARRENFILRARHTGTVTRVWFQPGDVVAAGASAVTLLIRGEQRVTGFLGEHISHAVTAGQDVLVEPARLSGFAQLTPARIRTISPDVAWLPTRVSPVQNQPIRGRRVSVALLEPIDLLPGEAVNIYVGRPWWIDAFEDYVPAAWRERLQRRSAFGRPTDTAR
ncbi:MAG: biotin/lipoyl-binding protein [Verrucomicrobia bacterium]|nr:biotin/lipoyl-binding protein [Verrucomicrobiota bacterium]